MTLRLSHSLWLAIAFALALTGCDQSSQNVDFETGDTYIISQQTSAIGDADSGSLTDVDSVTVPDTVAYSVDGFTIDKEYTWTVNGTNPPVEVRSEDTYRWEQREGEFITVAYTRDDPIAEVNSDGATTNTISVDASGDDIETERIEVNTVVPTLVEQVSRLPGTQTLAGLASTSGVTSALEAEGTSFTVFAPQNARFEGLSPTQATDEDEDPSTSVLGGLIRYHAVASEIAAGDVSDGQTVETLLGDEELRFEVDGNAITVNGTATVVAPDLPATDGVIHALDGVLTPSTALVDFTDREFAPDTTLAAGDSLTVDGSFFPEGGGFIVLHEQEVLQDGEVLGSIVGVSDYVEPGINNQVRVVLNESISSTTTLGAMPHTDSDGDEVYDFELSARGEDEPYTLSGEAVIDFGVITIPTGE